VKPLDRLHAEQAFHDRQARQRLTAFANQPGDLRLDDEAYLNHETWIRPAFAELGKLDGLRALDYGCGHGMAAVVMARRGARVTAFDLSPAYLDEARLRARASDVTVDWVRADAESLPFADGAFDRVWGNAVLHHLDLPVAARELRRVLRPGGIAVFCEPWDENPLLQWARVLLPYPGKERTAGEQPLGRRHLHHLRRVFADVRVSGFQLLSMVRRVVPPGPISGRLEWCDAALLARFPGLQRFCRYLVFTMRS